MWNVFLKTAPGTRGFYSHALSGAEPASMLCGTVLKRVIHKIMIKGLGSLKRI